MPHSIIIDLKHVENFIDYKVFSYGIIAKKDEFGNIEIVWENKKVKAFADEKKLEGIKEGDLVYFRGNVRKNEEKNEIKLFLDLIKKSNLKNKKTAKFIVDKFKVL
jgi:DNA/RNA endonuclease YhcR with UshA esterase domain